MVSISSTFVAVALYAPIATLRAFPYIDLILLVTSLRTSFSSIGIYYTAAPWLNADLAIVEYIYLPAANKRP